MDKGSSLDGQYSNTRSPITSESGPAGTAERWGGLRRSGYRKKTLPGKPLITVVTVVYNSPDLLRETIDSVAGQTYDNIEFIVVDGGSSDGKTLEVIEEHDGLIDCWISEHDGGIYDAMNKGMALASPGGYLNFLNAGDLYTTPESVSRVAAGMEGGANLVYCNIRYLQEGGKMQVIRAKDFTFDNLIRFGTSVLCHQAMFVKKELAPRYAEEYRFKGELNWYFDIVENRNLKAVKVDEELVDYSFGGFGYKNFIRNRMEWLKVVRKRYGLRAILRYDLAIYMLRNSRYRYEFMRKYYFLFRPLEWIFRGLAMIFK